MKANELKNILIREGFRRSTYSLEGGEPDEALCLSNEEGRWIVYYSERGLQTGRVDFDSEDAACDYFLEKMWSDPTTRRGWKSGFPLPPWG
jgi:hypothetical protein